MLLWTFHAGLWVDICGHIVGCCITYLMLHDKSPQSSACWTVILCCLRGFDGWEFWRGSTGQFLLMVSPVVAVSCQLGLKTPEVTAGTGLRSCCLSTWGLSSLDLSLRLSSPSLAFPRGSHPRKRGFPWIYFHFLFCLLVSSHLFLPHGRPGNYLHNARHWVWKRCRNMWVSCCGYFPLKKICISLFRRHLDDEWITSIQTWIKLVDTELSFSGPGSFLRIWRVYKATFSFEGQVLTSFLCLSAKSCLKIGKCLKGTEKNAHLNAFHFSPWL